MPIAHRLSIFMTKRDDRINPRRNFVRDKRARIELRRNKLISRDRGRKRGHGGVEGEAEGADEANDTAG